MGSKAECETPKLSLYSFPGKAKEPSGMLTPPLHASVSVPFQWEEAPGKPRPCPSTIHNNTSADQSIKPKAARCLELPPRLLAEAKVTTNNIPSPTTVLDGPDAARFVSYNTLACQKGGSFRSLQENKKVKVKFGSSRWGSFRKAGRVVQGSFDFSAPVAADGVDGAHDVKIKSLRRKGSLSGLGHMSWQAFMKAISKWSHGDVCKTN